MKKHNILKVVLITILVLTLLTWILPAAYYSSGYVDQGRIQMGIFDLFNYPFTTISYFGFIVVYVLVIGAFYGVLNKIGAYRMILDSLVKKFKSHEKIVISAIMILFAVLTSVCGLQFGLVLFFPFVISLILLMGYDKIVAALTVVGSTMIGIAGTTYGYTNTGLFVTGLGMKIDSCLLGKVAILVVGLAILIVNTLLYIKNNKSTVKTVETKSKKTTKSRTTKTSAKAAKKEEVVTVKNDETNEFVPEKSSKKVKLVWPLVTVLAILFIITVLSFITWSNSFNNTAFTNATKAVTEFKIFGFALFGKLLGTVKEFGTWTVSDLSIAIVLATLLISLIYKLSIDELLDGAVSGAKKAIKPAVIVVLVYTCLVITTYHPFQLVIYKAILGLSKKFNIATTGLVAILASLFNVDPTYAFNSLLPYLVSVYGLGAKTTIAIMFQSLYGFTMLFAPTSLFLMCVLSYLDIPYTKWLKLVWKLLLELFVAFIIVFIFVVLA